MADLVEGSAPPSGVPLREPTTERRLVRPDQTALRAAGGSSSGTVVPTVGGIDEEPLGYASGACASGSSAVTKAMITLAVAHLGGDVRSSGRELLSATEGDGTDLSGRRLQRRQRLASRKRERG